MRSLRSSLAIAALATPACLVSLPAPFASHIHKAPCGPSSAQTVVADSAARVYRLPAGQGPRGSVYNYYACAVGHAESQSLARRAGPLVAVRLYACPSNGCRSVRAIRLLGATVGVIVEHHGLDSIDSTLTVRRVVGARVLHRVPAYAVIGANTLIGGELLITYVLAPSGDMAWTTVCKEQIQCGHERGRPTSVGTVHRAIGHDVSALDVGPKVRASSLRLHGSTIEWIDGTVRRTASLP